MQALLNMETCHYCQQEKTISLHGQKFTSEKKDFNYCLCQSCCNQLAKLSGQKNIQLRLEFWQTVFDNGAIVGKNKRAKATPAR